MGARGGGEIALGKGSCEDFRCYQYLLKVAKKIDTKKVHMDQRVLNLSGSTKKSEKSFQRWITSDGFTTPARRGEKGKYENPFSVEMKRKKTRENQAPLEKAWEIGQHFKKSVLKQTGGKLMKKGM